MDLARYMPFFGIDDATLVSEIMNDNRLDFAMYSNSIYDPLLSIMLDGKFFFTKSLQKLCFTCTFLHLGARQVLTCSTESFFL